MSITDLRGRQNGRGRQAGHIQPPVVEEAPVLRRWACDVLPGGCAPGMMWVVTGDRPGKKSSDSEVEVAGTGVREEQSQRLFLSPSRGLWWLDGRLEPARWLDLNHKRRGRTGRQSLTRRSGDPNKSMRICTLHCTALLSIIHPFARSFVVSY